MKPVISRKDLQDSDSIWNAVVEVVSENDPVTDDPILQEASLVFQYYSLLESGGHEALLDWIEPYAAEAGMEIYSGKLLAVLEKIGARDYAAIEQTYGPEMRRLYSALRREEIEEDEWYAVIQKADEAYYRLDGKLEMLLEAYFIRIHTDLLEVVEK